MQSRIEEIHDLNAEVLAISVDSPEKNRALRAKLDLDFPLLSDMNLELIDALKVRHLNGGIGGDIARPATFILDRDRRIVWRQLTDNWRVRVRPEPVIEQLKKISSNDHE